MINSLLNLVCSLEPNKTYHATLEVGSKTQIKLHLSTRDIVNMNFDLSKFFYKDAGQYLLLDQQRKHYVG